MIRGGRPAPGYRLSLDARQFVSDPEIPLMAGENLILMSAEVGG
ncbi:MAG: hypothetical protein U0800_20940 [Isosphaeraceae bacterium]